MKYLELLYLFLPAFLANSTPLLIKNIPGIRRWNTPVCEKLFGKNKTIRGFVFGVGVATVVGMIQGELGFLFSSSALIGFLLGFGALVGDIVESFFKRRMNIAPGKALPFFDGVDYILGAMICVLPFFVPTWNEFLFLILFAPVISLISNIIAYSLGWKNVWY